MSRKYFGTDGIRGEANKDLSIDLVTNLGLALGYYLRKDKEENEKTKVILGTDTRISGYMIRSALSAGLTAMGVNVDFVGVLPTPGVSFLTRTLNADAGIMISASHNPIKDNGIKIFSNTGFKLSDNDELQIEELMENREKLMENLVHGEKLGRFIFIEDYLRMYRKFLQTTVKNDFKGYKVVIDTANGAAYRVAAKVLQNLGAEVQVINNIPTGKNINVDCGSTNPEKLCKAVKLFNANIGIAYDGDADRLIVVDEEGEILDGDIIVSILALNLQKKDMLNSNKVVMTVLSNMGVEKYLEDHGIRMIRANVGDRYVLEKMRKLGLNLGGEQSGHVIMLDYNTTGDGVLSSIQLMQAFIESGKKLSGLRKEIKLWPQAMINVPVLKEKKKNWDKNQNLINYINEKEEEILGEGRILVRPSGTENLIRVMVEARTKETMERILNEIVEKVKEELA
ncbi:phosphoglucosamine mutase [Streptobacillus moniliformis]|uniref:Phosphoglucosamine mutase n=1 Tax=Streptobacillus moniliformis (strain ATCC 14647 / DSM 12112 / NCTC 10651 / 9901) TaxID=519441 RepID=D1AXN8_STRM9|nr:phosphoglucosamine mutase [Streptobacillus moniliformis]ACZ01064.1 phosphoglucosamine mutase [Streptobacillus moniliformis DSM 12112]AVL42569.1 phosphoglucosamine mutase [Streptobacillus moniliformis]SQA13794.1 Phosphoglucosamine mutase [Streptobacillus moniliformis]